MSKTADPTPLLETAEIEAVRGALLRWYDEEHRELPWRTDPSEYATVVSEFMLQQTQIATALPYFERFTALFPSWRKLAEASEQDVLEAWSGLGYYRRARMLKRVAELVTRQYRGRLPRTPAELATLPGFGEYTVGAVGSIVMGLALPLVDGNVRRVIGRLMALRSDLTAGAGKRKLWRICGELVHPDRPGDFNQSLMDLGATVCLPREPLCLVCPIFEFCRARAGGFPEDYPPRPPSKRIKPVREVAVALFRGDKVLMLQRGEVRSFAGLWEFPRLDARAIAEAELSPERVLFDIVRLRAPQYLSVGRAESTFTHHRIQTELFRAEDAGSQPLRRQAHVAHRWVRPDQLTRMPVSKAQRRLLDLLLNASEPAASAPRNGAKRIPGRR